MRTFVVPLDGSKPAEAALHVAHRVAQNIGGELCLVRVSPPDEAKADAAYLEAMAATIGGMPVSTMVVAVEPGERVSAGIIRAVEASGPNAVLCLTLRGHSALETALVGSTAEDLLRDYDRPILVAPLGRPSG